MKKIIFVISLLAMSVAVNAQLKVLSTGKVIVADTASTSAANLTVGPVQSVSGTVGITSATAGTAMYNRAEVRIIVRTSALLYMAVYA